MSKNYMPSSWNGTAPPETSWYDADPAVKLATFAVERFRRASESLTVTRAFALPAASGLAKSTTARVKAACFQFLMKAPKANSFVLDSDDGCSSSNNQPAHRRAHSGCDLKMRGGCGACARSRKPLPGGFGHHVRRYYGRCAGCFRWTGTGARRVTPPAAASQETWPEAEMPRPRNLGQSRGGAPRGERADRKARAASERCGSSELRFSALRLPSFYLEAATFLAWCGKLGRGCVARTRSLIHLSPR